MNRSRRSIASSPTFALLREKRQLLVRNPENGVRFTITLRDWQEMLWAVRVHPEPQWQDYRNAYTTAHRIMRRTAIEDWLAELKMENSAPLRRDRGRRPDAKRSVTRRRAA